MRKRGRTFKADYASLYDSPLSLFPPGPASPGVAVKLVFRDAWGLPSILLTDPRTGESYKVTTGTGPAGFSVTVARAEMAGDPAITVRAYDRDYSTVARTDDAREVGLTIYNADARSQAFKRWYDGEETDADRAILRPDYHRSRERKEGF